jgi:hypothetical protein
LQTGTLKYCVLVVCPIWSAEVNAPMVPSVSCLRMWDFLLLPSAKIGQLIGATTNAQASSVASAPLLSLFQSRVLRYLPAVPPASAWQRLCSWRAGLSCVDSEGCSRVLDSLRRNRTSALYGAHCLNIVLRLGLEQSASFTDGTTTVPLPSFFLLHIHLSIYTCS